VLKSNVAAVFNERRKKLMAMDPDGCFVLFGAGEVTRNNDVHYSFRQDSNFLYLTDFDEQDAVLVLVAGETHLFVLERDLDREIWDGERYGVDRAKAVFQVDHSYLVKEFYSKLEELLADAKRVYYSLGENNNKRDAMMISVLKRASRYQGKGSHGSLPLLDWQPLVSKLRIVKDDFDLQNIRKACSISARAHTLLLKRVRAGMSEFEASAEFQYFVFKNGCTDLGYGPIFAGGYNATTLHYSRNNELLKHGDLLLVDAGGEVNSYTADITQTFPISGTFSTEQKKVYEKVLQVNRTIISELKPGLTYRDVHTRSVELIIDSLLSLGVLTGSVKENIESKDYRKYFPHGLGHYLGLDVHDAGLYDNRGVDVKLEAGMLITVEPGLYFRDRGNPYYGIGVRIEDDVLLTDNGCEVLTHELPRTVDELQNLRTIANS